MSTKSSLLNYTGIFFSNDTHMTWNYGFPLVYPDNIQPGISTTVTVIGKYADEQVACLIVRFQHYTHQPKGTILHITTKAMNGGKPVMSGIRATQYGYQSIEPYQITGVWK